MTALKQARRTAVLTTLESDSHTWNLVFLQLLLEEQGFTVVNLGPCCPDELILDECVRLKPDLLVVSSVNGHGGRDAMRLIGALRSHPVIGDVPAVIGGMLRVDDDDTVFEPLLAAGFDAVFLGGADELAAFCGYVREIEPARTA